MIDRIRTLLIRIAPGPAAAAATAVTSEQLRSAYTREYYLQGCGGWDAFEADRGETVGDPRLRAVFAVALPWKEERVLDLGCGRGELSCQAARYGATVTGVDYAPAAIDLARSCLEREPAIADRVSFVCAQLADFSFRGPYDKVLASDLVEHLADEEVETLYARVAETLSPIGIFVVHTYPNRWFYDYGHAAKRRKAKKLGCFLPRDPRPPYERLMHINEQSPPALRRQLARHFAHVALWFGSPEDPAGNLMRRFGKNELRDARDLFAVASHAPIDLDRIRRQLVQPPLPEACQHEVRLEIRDAPVQVQRGQTFSVRGTVVNRAADTVSSGGRFALHVSYHWTSESGVMHVFDGQRSVLPGPIPAAATSDVIVRVVAPSSPGRYRLQPRLVQEHVAWLEAEENAKPRYVEIDVV